MAVTPMEAIVAATRDGAETAKLKTGLIAAGRNAVFIVLAANPLDSIAQHADDREGVLARPASPAPGLGGQMAGGVRADGGEVIALPDAAAL